MSRRLVAQNAQNHDIATTANYCTGLHQTARFCFVLQISEVALKSVFRSADIVGMNAKTESPSSPRTVTEIQTRIGEERHRLLSEQNLYATLEGQRIAPLEAGDDEALDRVEEKIVKCLERQARIEERIELLQKRLDESVESERNADLDAIEARASTLREQGERLIRTEYPKLAGQLGSLLKRLQLIDAAIERENRTLQQAGRDQVPASNYVRCTPAKYLDFIETINVHPSDPRHSMHANAVPSRRTQGREEHAVWVDSRDSSKIIECESIQVQTRERIGGLYPPPLHEIIVLPAVEPIPYMHTTLAKRPVAPPYFEHDSTQISEADIEALFAEFESQKLSKRKTA